MDGNGNDRISVSRDALRAELTTLKLDLIQTLASKAEVDRLTARVGVIELHGSPSLTTVKEAQHELDLRLGRVENELRDRPKQVQEHEQMMRDVGSLKTRRNRSDGALGVVAAIASAAAGKLFGWF